MLPAGRQGCDASVRAMHASPQSEEKEPADGKRGPLGLTPPSRARGALLPWVAPTWRTLPCTRPLAARGGRLCRTLCAGVSGARRACRALRTPASPTRPRSFTDAVSCSAYPLGAPGADATVHVTPTIRGAPASSPPGCSPP